MDDLDVRVQVELERRHRAERARLAPLHAWYDESCPCGLEPGDCLVHPRARAEQRPPAWAWQTWLMMAGRGAGKTVSASQYVQHKVQLGHWMYVGICGATTGDVYKYQIAGPSGLLKIAPPWFMPTYIPSKALVTWPNGAVGYLFTAEVPEELRGANLDGFWGDEPGKWKRQADVFEQIDFILRNRTDPPPELVLSSTPRPSPIMFTLEDQAREDEEARAMGLEPPNGVAITRWSTQRNIRHLDPKRVRSLYRKYEGTRVGLQELEGLLLRDIPGALWRREMFERSGFRPDRLPLGVQLRRIVVGVDPARGGDDPEAGSETGIVAAGLGSDGIPYVLGDFTVRGSPAEWGEVAVWAYHALRADLIVGEVNNGGKMVEHVIRTVPATAQHPSGRGVNYERVNATHGKDLRAEPIAAFYERGEVRHLKPVLGGQVWVLAPTAPGQPGRVFPVDPTYAAMEDQLLRFVPPRPDDDGKPRRNQRLDRMDALVWTLTDLLLGEVIEDPDIPVVGLPRPAYAQAIDPYNRWED